jgi:periplasmic protein TonB
MKLLIIILLSLPILHGMAQNPPPPPPPKVDTATAEDDAKDDRTFTKLEVEAEYPGGLTSWHQYLVQNLHYPHKAKRHSIEGTVVVQCIVHKQGLVSDIQAIAGPEELREEAVRLVKDSGKWTPGTQNGHIVRSYKKIPIEFKLSTE